MTHTSTPTHMLTGKAIELWPGPKDRVFDDELTLTLQTCAEEKRVRVRQMWLGAVSDRPKRTLTVRES